MIRTSLALVLLALPAWSAPLIPQSQEDETDAHGYDKVRIEQEDKLLVPKERVEEVWEFLRQRLVEDKQFLAELDPGFTSKWSEELFLDTYFDTPSLQLHAMQSGVRHRRRTNLSNPDDPKSGRELMQIKLNDISSNELERAEIKYEIENNPRPSSAEDRHPMLGRVKKEYRGPFQQKLREIGLDPQSMRPILTVHDVRRRVYILKDDKPFMSISHDQASSSLWWARSEFCELEPELNEIGFTEADEATRTYMESVLARIVMELRTKFPDIQQDLTPKYNKSFNRLEADLPFLRTLVRTGLQDDGVSFLVFGALLVIVAGMVVPPLLRRRRSQTKRAAAPSSLPELQRQTSPV